MRLVRGVGINDAGYVVNPGGKGLQTMCPYYKTWMNMLNRVYTPSKNDKSYNGCRVCDDWLRFSCFRDWMISQDWQGKCLDKDLRVEGNLVYGPDTCCFISNRLNVALSKRKQTRALPTGVVYSPSGKYISQIGIDSVITYLGTFNTVDEADSVYQDAYASYVKRVAMESDSKQVSEIVEIRFAKNEVHEKCKNK